MSKAWILAPLAAATSAPVLAGVIAIGSSNARLCYEAAESLLAPTVRSLAYCDAAVRDAGLSHHDRAASHVNRGILRMRRNRIAEAISDFDSAALLNPNEAEAYQNKGAAMIQLNHAREALALFDMALERNPERPALAYLGRGVASEALGDIPAAYREVRRAAELEPDSPDVQAMLARFQVVPQ